MAIVNFETVKPEDKTIGGKAFHLANLFQRGLPVPRGIVISEALERGDFAAVMKWWQANQSRPLAVRSSASDEDGGEFSFAGQNSTFLNVKEESELKTAILNCFKSINRLSSVAYREKFLGLGMKPQMNVVLQEMIKPKFAGVYFSIDPRDPKAGDLIEYVSGLGESLVSGEVTPFRVQEGQQNDQQVDWQETYASQLRTLAREVKSYLNDEIDMEWAIDFSGRLFLLQVRPVTAKSDSGRGKNYASEELERIKRHFPEDNTWDGQTFSEWAGLPSPLTYSVFREAFSNHFAYEEALKKLGYSGFRSGEKAKENESVLDLIFGRAYINLRKLKPLFFGPIPYRIVADPHPHLKFDPKLIDFKTILQAPISMFRMLKVGWNLSSNRSTWLNECSSELVNFHQKMNRPLDPNLYESWTDSELKKRLSKEIFVFSKHHLVWPFVLTILIESAMRSLSAITRSVLGKEESDHSIKRWLSEGIQTSTFEMKRYYVRAGEEPQKQPFFLARYGHRGPGELDLKNPRWIELGEKAFSSPINHQLIRNEKKKGTSIEDEIGAMPTFKKTIILQEWKLLKSMLELRERWKMAILRPFAQIRFIVEEISHRCELNSDVYYLSKQEILGLPDFSEKSIQSLKDEIDDRKAKEVSFRLFSFPTILSRDQIERSIRGEHPPEETVIHGEVLSPGLVYGTIKIVRDPISLNLESLNAETIVVAEATDPGWTPIFSACRGVIVEKGGVLSHAAIVAREMGIPALSGVENCLNRFRDGQKICLNCNSGVITYE